MSASTLSTTPSTTSHFSKRNECELNKTPKSINKNEIVKDDDKQLKIFLHMIEKRLQNVSNIFTYAEFCKIHGLCFGIQPFNHPQLPRNCHT